ncbi:MAG: alkaline phosphatase family protein, partial [Cyclobacteriaceae bacterium]|nr:alkaline phosphatase family protein [Cyclobacteriaceae bacterium]
HSFSTDHGRKAMDGKGHGGQSERERTIWITTNKKTNSIFKSGKARMVDIMPSILEFMEVELPDQIKQELDGLSFLSAPDFYDLNTNIINGKTRLIWKPLSKSTTGKILFSKSDYFKDGKSDVYKLLDTVELQKGEYVIPDTLLVEDYVKIVLKSEGQTSNIWVYKDSTWMKTNH